MVAGFFILPRVATTKMEKSIAVLPFENYSDDKANTYFADGIQGDILTALWLARAIRNWEAGFITLGIPRPRAATRPRRTRCARWNCSPIAGSASRARLLVLLRE